MLEEHADFRNKYQKLNNRVDKLAAEMCTTTVEYTLAEKYTEIDQGIYELHVWYDEKKKMFENYTREKMKQEEKMNQIIKKIESLSGDIKSQEFSRVLRQD